MYVFTAAMGPGLDRTYAPNARVQFPVVLTNVGEAFDATANEFQCPVTGLYLFTMSLLSQHRKVGVAHIIVNGERKVSMHPDGRDAAYGHSTNVVLTECEAGHKVSIQVHPSKGTGYFHDSGYNLGTFSGVLLHLL